MIAIIDYGTGNLLSIENMLKRVGRSDIVISNDIEEINKADKLILPGVGHFDHGMKSLEKSGLIDILNKKVIEDKTPILGICLGLQLMTHGSTEGSKDGLGWLDARTIHFRKEKMCGLKVPHMGWADVEYNISHPLFKELPRNARFYFVHSYHVETNNEDHIISKASYGYDFVAGMAVGNIMAVQFHPEKSHKYGMKLLMNFTKI